MYRKDASGKRVKTPYKILAEEITSAKTKSQKELAYRNYFNSVFPKP